jgi:hypothetical protein
MANWTTAQGKVPTWITHKAEYTNHHVKGRVLKVTYRENGFAETETLFRVVLGAKPTYAELRKILADNGFALAGDWRQTASTTLVARVSA